MTNKSLINDTFPQPVPKPYRPADAERGWQEWQQYAARSDDADLRQWMTGMRAGSMGMLLEGIFGNSPYLTHLVFLYPQLVCAIAQQGFDATYQAIFDELAYHGDDTALLMPLMRTGKGKLALLTALADISGAWPLERVTEALSRLAEHTLQLSIDTLLRGGVKRGEIILPHPDAPSQESGIIVLGMGKLGGYELNYSSDIDLIIFYEPGLLSYKGRHTEQHFMNKLAHDLVNLMQERTKDGYVFRTDLRLRPDPASTPPAITINAAHYYYESVGQNWERAAMIKARPVAGDIAAGERFLTQLAPFMWRRSLDFASIRDIHSIKRQMDSIHSKVIQIESHNIKLGQGGIREIEFYVQIHQLIWGGRETVLRSRGTCETLRRLTEYGLVDEAKEMRLIPAYTFLRKLEHRLQMVADQQTHSLPDTREGVDHIACFMGYDSTADFERELLDVLHGVHDIYANSFKSSAEGLGDEGNLVFTGTIHDPDTLNTLRSMGYTNVEAISETVMGWHHGSRKSTRTKRARELLTEMMPTLLKRLGETVQPDAAFLKFDEFLANLPAGVQLFSLFGVNPHLLGLIADIMGSAPTLADTLSKSPELLDAVLYADFYSSLPSQAQLKQQLQEVTAHLDNFEDVMDTLRRFRNEKQFQAGVQLLKRMITAPQAGHFLSMLAELMVQTTLTAVTAEFERTYGRIPGCHFGVLAMGKLGSREMTFSSDIDLVFIYDAADFDAVSDGEKSFTAAVYYNRLCQRFLSALTAMSTDGRLYEVDTRLRPSGKQGLLAVSTKALAHYFDELAWTFEYMAFTKARVVAGDEEIRDKLDDFVRAQLTKPRDKEKLRADVVDMRGRVEKENGTENIWDIKYVRGGLMDVDFLAQYLMLYHAPETPGAAPGAACEIFDWLKRTGRLDAAKAAELTEADRFLGQIFNMLRLCCDRHFIEDTAPQGLKKLLVESVKEQDFQGLRNRLIRVEQKVLEHYISCLQP